MVTAAATSERLPVSGRVDLAGNLVAADPRLEALQNAAGGSVGKPIALPQIAAVVRLAAELKIAVKRPAVAASGDHDLDLWVRAIPDETGVDILIESWAERPASGPQLLSLVGNGAANAPAGELETSWAVNEELRIISIAPDFARLLGTTPEGAIGEPLTKLLRLEENEDAEMPLLMALASRRSFTGQAATMRRGNGDTLVLAGEATLGAGGTFAGFQGAASVPTAPASVDRVISFDDVLDETLRSPIDRIIEQAEQIVRQSDGPIQSNYAAYGNDIAAAARHLLSVVGTMNAGPASEGVVDLAEVARDAIVMLEAAAVERRISIQVEASRRLPAFGDERAVIQILVNLIGNAIRHSPDSGRVMLRFARDDGMVSLSVEDQGPGIAPADVERIFERFERASDDDRGTGLGLAISRRLARSMGGDVELETEIQTGARFTLRLPFAGN